MAANLTDNIRTALTNLNIRNVFCRTDANDETEKEAKKIKTVLAADNNLFEADKFDILLEKYNL